MKVTTDACLFGAWVAEKVKSEKLKMKNVLDVGAGTGLLSLMFAQKKTGVVIDSIEIDADAYDQAKENIAASPFAGRIKTIRGDARNFSFQKKYDLIISNPPFYETELKSEKENKNIAHHGDELSLSELFVTIENNLEPDGRFFLLLPYKRYEEIRRLFAKSKLMITELLLIRQSTRHHYFRIILRGEFARQTAAEIQMDELSICNEKQQYTIEFIELLKDYYLYL